MNKYDSSALLPTVLLTRHAMHWPTKHATRILCKKPNWLIL